MQGFNMGGPWVPPDQEGTTSGNKLQRRRAPGTLKKDGTQTVRFEMPFAVWCHTCRPHAILGQGTRYNAEKARVGNYFSTPIWQFRMKHTACGGFIEIRTDPKNAAYVVTAGGKARDYGEPEDKVREGEGGIPILTEAERQRRRDDAFASLESKVEEKQAVKDNTKRIEELYRERERDWDDPWSANKRLRTTFRHERKIRKRDDDATQALKDRLGTKIDLLPETEDDKKRAKLITFGDAEATASLNSADSKELFGRRTPKSTSSSSGAIEESRKDALRKQLLGNTRAVMNPFGANTRPPS